MQNDSVSNLTPIEVSDEIRKICSELQSLYAKLDDYARAKVVASSDYEKELALVMLRLRSGGTLQLGEEESKDIPTTIIEKVSRGHCWHWALERDKADIKYRNLIKKIDIKQAQLNAWQSINRHLQEV